MTTLTFIRSPEPSNRNIPRSRAALLFGAFACIGCGGNGEGRVTVRAYGEAFIEEGIPADAVKDGWTVEFDKFVVHIEDVSIASTAVVVDAKVDVSKDSAGEGHEIGSAWVRQGSHSHASFAVTRVEIEGSASKSDVTKTFSWDITDATRYSHCETTTTVSTGGEATFQITIHADHLLYDSLVSDEPDVLFQAYADADTDTNGAISEEELRARDIADYDPGSEDGIDDMWTWLVAQSRTLGHVDGEGHCAAKPLK